MSVRLLFRGILATCFLLPGFGCERDLPAVSAKPAAEPLPISGLYEVEGFTIDTPTGANKRAIGGKVILKQEGDTYTATFELDAEIPGGSQYEATVIGNGEGSIDGRTLTGTADTQLVESLVPGVDPGFAYIPRSVTTRITSTSRVEITPEGEAVMTIENQGAEVDNEYIYVPSKTRMTGRRIGEAGLAGIPRRKAADSGAPEE